MSDLQKNIVVDLRNMARRGDSVAAMFKTLRTRLGPEIIPIMDHMRSAFCLSLAEAKPLAALSRTDGPEVGDDARLEQLVMPAIAKHREDWEYQQQA